MTIYPPLDSTGTLNESPTATIGDDPGCAPCDNTGLAIPFGITLDSSGNIYVANSAGGPDAIGSVTVYPPLGTSTGTLNESPLAAISDDPSCAPCDNTELASPAGVGRSERQYLCGQRWQRDRGRGQRDRLCGGEQWQCRSHRGGDQRAAHGIKRAAGNRNRSAAAQTQASAPPQTPAASPASEEEMKMRRAIKMRFTMRINCILLLIAALMLGLSASARAQVTCPSAAQAQPAKSPPKSGEVYWYGAAPPGLGGVVTKMKLLAPGVGWAMRAQHLYWTTDNGANWMDITPTRPDSYHNNYPWNIVDGFFLDASSGWILFAHYDEPTPEFAMASTNNAGATWSVRPVAIPANAGNLDPQGRIAFADALHGWIEVDLDTAAFHAGTLFMTSDGGRTWQRPPADPGGQGPIFLVSREVGWMVGDGDNSQLYVTRDGSKSWQMVSLPGAQRDLSRDRSHGGCAGVRGPPARFRFGDLFRC